jgi:uncharacterized membrane protein YfcA
MMVALTGTVLMTFLGICDQSNKVYPSGTLGYVYWPAALGIAITSVATAPLGTRLSFMLSIQTLKRVFAVLLFISAWNLVTEQGDFLLHN